MDVWRDDWFCSSSIMRESPSQDSQTSRGSRHSEPKISTKQLPMQRWRYVRNTRINPSKGRSGKEGISNGEGHSCMADFANKFLCLGWYLNFTLLKACKFFLRIILIFFGPDCTQLTTCHWHVMYWHVVLESLSWRNWHGKGPLVSFPVFLQITSIILINLHKKYPLLWLKLFLRFWSLRFIFKDFWISAIYFNILIVLPILTQLFISKHFFPVSRKGSSFLEKRFEMLIWHPTDEKSWVLYWSLKLKCKSCILQVCPEFDH